MVYKSDSGKVKIHQTSDATAGKGAPKGGGLGLLVGIFAAPLMPAVAVGAGHWRAHREGTRPGYLRQAHRASR